MARVLGLLYPYFERDTPQAVREMEAEDWAEALDGLPEWAITDAVRWWKGADNPKRRQRPVEGDIVARCQIEMDAVNAAQRLVTLPPRVSIGRENTKPVSGRRAAEILREVNFNPKRFGGANA